MKVKEIKYGSKANSPVPVKGPAPNDAELKTVKEEATMATGKVVANDGKTITVAMPDGTQIQKPIMAAIAKDAEGKPVFNVASAPQPGVAPGAGQPPQTPQQQYPTGSTMPVNTGAPMEETNNDPNDEPTPGDKTDDFIDDVVDAGYGHVGRTPRQQHEQVQHPSADDELLEKMRTIAGLR